MIRRREKSRIEREIERLNREAERVRDDMKALSRTMDLPGFEALPPLGRRGLSSGPQKPGPENFLAPTPPPGRGRDALFEWAGTEFPVESGSEGPRRIVVPPPEDGSSGHEGDSGFGGERDAYLSVIDLSRHRPQSPSRRVQRNKAIFMLITLLIGVYIFLKTVMY